MPKQMIASANRLTENAYQTTLMPKAPLYFRNDLNEIQTGPLP